jgi:hypothetical protein
MPGDTWKEKPGTLRTLNKRWIGLIKLLPLIFTLIRPNHDFVERRITLDANFTPEDSPEERAAFSISTV